MAHHIKAVFFDHGGVLTLGGGKGTNEAMAARAMGLEKPINVPDLSEALKLGHITNNHFVQAVNKRYSAPRQLTATVWDEILAALTPEPLSYSFVHRCAASGRQIGLLSNISLGMAMRLHERGDYSPFGKRVLLSCYMHKAKPADEVYARAEATLPGINREEILLFDDQDKCVTAAIERGWHAIKVSSPEQMIRDGGRLLNLS